jgi:hypothetical protein
MGFDGRFARKKLRRTRGLHLEGLETRALLSATDDFTWFTSSSVIGPHPETLLQAAAMPAAADGIVQAAADDHGHGMDDHGPIHADDPTAPFIHLQHDAIPNFVRNPTASTVKSGRWSDPTVWSNQRVPRFGEVVQVSSGTVIDYDTVSTTSIRAVGVNPGGTLRFSSKVSTRMTVGTLIVFEGGSLQIGQANNPVSVNAKAEIVFDGSWLYAPTDPKQYGVGLLGFGEVSVYGAPKSRTWLRLGAEAKAGDSYIDLETKVSGWQVGETIFLPDSRQIPGHMVDDLAAGVQGIFSPEWEEATIARIVGKRVYLTSPLKYSHLGARNENDVLEFLPHVAVLERNVVFRSLTPNGKRGHVLLGGRADVDIRYARFESLGRTDATVPLDTSTVDELGVVTHVGTNQIGRYSLHIHHLIGPANSANTGYQFQLIGNSLDDGRKWGIAVHGASYGLIQDNFAYEMQGAGFVTEDGSEIENDFYRNFAAKILGTNAESRDDLRPGHGGRSGSGFWLRRAGNNLRDNVVANASFAGVIINGYWSDDLPLPAFRGALVSEPGQGIIPEQQPVGTIKNLEMYGRMRHGFWMLAPLSNTTYSANMTIRRLHVWHTDGNAIEAYRFRGLSIVDSVLLGDRRTLGIAPRWTIDRESIGIKFHTYEASDVKIINTRIANQFLGILAPEASAGFQTSGVPAEPTKLENVTLANYVNLQIPTTRYFRGQYSVKAIEVADSLFRPVDTTGMYYPSTDQIDIKMVYAAAWRLDDRNLMSPDLVTIKNFNRVPNDNFQVYYTQQSPSFIPPEAPMGNGSPAPGLTNAQLWAQHGVALAGGVAPCDTTRPGIVGFVCPIAASSPPAVTAAARSQASRFVPIGEAVDEALKAR